MANFYKMDPAVWDATTALLTLEEEAAYLRICNAIYKAERGCPDHPRVLAGMFRCSTRKAVSILNRLLEAGKVFRRDGVIWNEKAEREIGHINKKRLEPNANRTRNSDEPPSKQSRTGDELDANPARNDAEPSRKPLKSAEKSNGEPPPRLDKTREEKTRKDLLKDAFEDFWKSYPRRRQENGALTRGSKKSAMDQFLKLSSEEREIAVKGLAGFSRLYPDDSKAVCDAERYFAKKRWLDVEGIDETPAEFVPYPDGALGGKVKEFAALVTVPRYKSYFVRDGESIFGEDDDGVYITVLSDFQAETIRNLCIGQLKRVFGASNFRMKLAERAAA